MSTLPAPHPPASDNATGTATRTKTAVDSPEHTRTRTVVAPGFSVAPELGRNRGVKLQHILLAATVLLVLVIISLLAGIFAYSTSTQFDQISRGYNERIQASTQELGLTVSHTLSLTSASALRDSNYGFLAEVVQEIIQKNPNVLRVQMSDPEELVIADSDPDAELGSLIGRAAARGSRVGAYRGRPVFEYQEPIDYGSQAGKGLVVLTYSLEPLQAELRVLEAAKVEAVRQAVLRSAGIGGGFVLLAGLLAAVFSRRITRPLADLTRVSMDLASGNLEARVPPSRASREVSTLGAVFNHMADRMSYLLEDARTRAVLERDMALARQVQEALLPSGEPLEAGPLRIAGRIVTADACGGDWWLRAQLEPNKVVLGVGDATGHGLAAALVATSACAGFAAAIQMRDPSDINARTLIGSLNQTLFLVGRGEHQMSAALAVIDLTTGEIDYAGGGHPSALVVNRHSGEVTSLLSRGSLLGASASTQYSSRAATLKPGDLVVWYTDGLTESENTSRVQYGTQRLLACLKSNMNLPAERLRDAIIFDLRNHSGSQPQNDDITVVVAEFTPTSPPRAEA